MSPPDAKQIKRAGWRQFSFLSREFASVVSENEALHLEDGDRLITCSHDCDITNQSLEAEPYVEILILKPIPSSSRDGSLFWGKNPRRFQFDLSGPTLAGTLETDIHDRFRTDRSLLVGALPDERTTLPDRVKRQIVRWLAKRYARAAFPDAFNLRVSPAIPAIEKLLKKTGQKISGLYIGLNHDHELPLDEEYAMVLRATMEADAFVDKQLRSEAEKTIAKIALELGECKGVCVADAKVDSEADFSLDDLRVTKDWTMDSFSLRTDPEGSLTPHA